MQRHVAACTHDIMIVYISGVNYMSGVTSLCLTDQTVYLLEEFAYFLCPRNCQSMERHWKRQK